MDVFDIESARLAYLDKFVEDNRVVSNKDYDIYVDILKSDDQIEPFLSVFCAFFQHLRSIILLPREVLSKRLTWAHVKLEGLCRPQIASSPAH